ncbi:uncharacterized protein LOC100680442 isoform X2 [Nasonia vitripennis]|uniref:Myb/SANT-like DNA-binding domain-containing protein n=1 Tax=Nasonia vitripennis TaxID=7425 RepID=A0A7M7H2W7_NASVI|nr:uncharacterized protein LOC100680442 isoform X2 [Nasonia vitripennis]
MPFNVGIRHFAQENKGSCKAASCSADLRTPKNTRRNFGRMSESGDKYKWTPESTTLLVSVWTDKQVQKQLEHTAKPQLIWESVARYMNKKGYNVTGKQCRSRMKQVLVCYREAKRAGTRGGVEQYYDSIDRVLKVKKLEQYNNNGIDTVDSTTNIKSPPKDVKTNKNLQMRCKYQQPAESIYRTEALSPVWSGGHYPDSPESNETVLAQPFRVLSPVRDAATNTTQHQLGQINKKVMHQNGICEEIPIKENYRPHINSNNYFSEIPFQNTVQNVQNQIIQENMQQNQALLQQNLLQNQLMEHNRLQMNPILRQNIQNVNQGLYSDQGIAYNQGQLGFGQNVIAENVLRMQNKCQLNSVNNRAMPQEPRKNSFRQNLAATHRQFQEFPPNYNFNLNQLGFLSPSISPDIPPNLNEAFCQAKNEKSHGLNETFSRPSPNQLNVGADVTGITNNATFNDDTISIEFLQDSPSPDNEPTKLKDFAVNTDEIPNAPFRKKKAEKLERLMMSAINSQNEVVNKILAAQNDMVTRVLDLDRDRQNRLENRLDHLLDVVQTAVLNKSSESKNSDAQSVQTEPVITNLVPPPKPGVIPPKLDLVPPKPCRVPCTVSNANSQPINQNPVMTRPGVVSPIMSPSGKVGAIWQKLGPVSTSPFVRAQQQLGFRPVHAMSNNYTRTQSLTERRIAKEFESGMDTKTLIFETANFLGAERQLQEDVENARIKSAMEQDLQARRGLYTQREPSAAQILSAAFLDTEIHFTEVVENAWLNWLRKRQMENRREMLNIPINQYNQYKYNDYDTNDGVKRSDEILLAGQGESYDRMREINARERLIGNPCDSSTPAKEQRRRSDELTRDTDEPRQTIQQLAQLVMNSGRWKKSIENQRKELNYYTAMGAVKPTCSSGDQVILRNAAKEATTTDNRPQYGNRQTHPMVDGQAKTLDWLQDRFSYGSQATNSGVNRNNAVSQDIANRFATGPQKPPRPMGFTTEFLNSQESNNNNNIIQNQRRPDSDEQPKRVGFVYDNNVDVDDNRRNRFAHEEKDPFEELHQFYIQKQFKLQQSKGLPFMLHNGQVILPESDMIDRYMQDTYPRNKNNREAESDNDEEFLDTTMSMPSSRKNSITSNGTKSVKAESGCIIS